MQFTSNNLTFVIVTFNSRKVIHDCLNSLPKDFHKLIIENSSDAELKKELEQNYVNTKVILSTNIGMGAGNNIGIANSKTKFVYVLNPDVKLSKDTFKFLNDAISGLKDFAIISPISDNPKFPNYKEETNIPYMQMTSADKRPKITSLEKDQQEQNSAGLIRAKEIDGFSMILNKDYFTDNIFFDEKFFMYLENVDLCLRAMENNGKIFIVKNSKINHLGAKAVDDKYNDEIELSRNWHWMWSKFYFNKKHRGIFVSNLLGLNSLLTNFLKYSMHALILNKKKNIYKMRMLGILNALMGKKSWFRPELN